MTVIALLKNICWKYKQRNLIPSVFEIYKQISAVFLKTVHWMKFDDSNEEMLLFSFDFFDEQKFILVTNLISMELT